MGEVLSAKEAPDSALRTWNCALFRGAVHFGEALLDLGVHLRVAELGGGHIHNVAFRGAREATAGAEKLTSL